MSSETRERIRDAAQALGWRPSASARALTESRARAIGLVLHRDTAQLEMDAFFVRFLSGIEQTLASHDCALLLQLMPAGTEDLEAYERLAGAGRVDGFLLTDVVEGDPRIPLLEAAELPAVVAGRPDDGCPFPWIETEHGPGMAAAARHLESLGHSRVGFLGGEAGLRFVQERERHWREALSSPGPVAYEDPDAVLDSAPSAVACTSDALAFSLLSAAAARGLRVPDDLSVTGFDDSPLAQLASPSLTSVRVDYTDYGAAAAAALLATIDGVSPGHYSASPPDLIVRGSTAPAR